MTDFLGRFSDCQVAGPALAVLDLAGRCHAESFLGGFMGFLLGHDTLADGWLLGKYYEGTKV
jgi:hypothetical protein